MSERPALFGLLAWILLTIVVIAVLLALPVMELTNVANTLAALGY